MKELNLIGYKRYFVTEDGKIYAEHLGRYLKPYNNGLGYLAVKLKRLDGHRGNFYVHRLVAMCYIDNPKNLPDINHVDGNKSNNHFSNLEWTTKSDNLKRAFRLGLLDGFVKKYRGMD